MRTMEKISKVIEEFNRLHGNETHAKLKEIKGEEVIIEFEGSFCKTCGLFDYFEDIKWEAMGFGIIVEPIEILEFEEKFETGKYSVKYKVQTRDAKE